MTEAFRWPAPLKAGDTVFVTAPSAGVPPLLHARLDLALQRLRAQGWRVEEGRCLRQSRHQVSAPAPERAAEWQGALLNPDYQAVLAPWGGERAIELLPHLDFERLRAAPPKWVSGFSDLSTLYLPLSLCARWVTLHGPNLMELGDAELNPTTAGLLQALTLEPSEPWVQHPSAAFRQGAGANWREEPTASLRTDTPTCWRLLREDMPRRAQGRLIGGCLETVSRLAGTRYAPLQAGGPWLLYLEACEAAPYEVARTLHSLALHGWFAPQQLAGLLIGRSSALEQTEDGYSGWSALEDVLRDFTGPVVMDMDIGHRPPQITLANGAWAEICMEEGAQGLVQHWRPA
ncbi:muramoyltetrapeptide carboxypeptidase LdcA involved in peptidoglycan recycling [Inhella inkyongensis]|uniref:Muramoyltetrapeptide carboxypeptidase LdcA involved in peptidoglycan recycling n=1 Tax=Inhella inkyongensis TaxID=392593 RepID=A0A840S183_9BURK|nr:S66 peptidase family protein [Inhella inkyongensis]MBB5204035.1 muramoyltetrapeptide carboxypeptidase LdcA involved in peptidoglycan recycling [Inhella inkyongensis]